MKTLDKPLFTTQKVTKTRIIGKNEEFMVYAAMPAAADFVLDYDGELVNETTPTEQITAATADTSWDKFKNLVIDVDAGTANLDIDWSCLVDGKIADVSKKKTCRQTKSASRSKAGKTSKKTTGKVKKSKAE